MLRDDENLYFFVRAFDSSPDSIMRALSRRDVRGPSDPIGIFIDSYNDRRTGFGFYVNPNGVKRDFSIYDDNFHDNSWNGVWDVATTVDSLGWTAEFRVPLSQLRYADADAHTFGFGVRREPERRNERSSWPLFDRNTSGFMSQMGELGGLDGLDTSRRVELTPYGVTKTMTRARASGGWETVPQASAGGDLKIGITPNMTLDATVNPDFGQVKADPAVLNLTAFETFVSERRPFFVEGTGLYAFSLNCYIVVDCSTNEGLFYSRRIGRNPSLRASGDVTTPEATPIAGALKLTGRSSGGLSYGVLDAVTRQVSGKYAGGFTRFESSLVRQSAGFEPNDLGYLRRADIMDWSTWASLNFQTPTRSYRWLPFTGNHWQHWNTSGLALENAWNFNGHIGLHNNWNFHAGGTLGGLGEVYSDRNTRGGPPLRQSRWIAPWLGFNGDSRRMVVPGMWVNLSRRDEGRTAT